MRTQGTTSPSSGHLIVFYKVKISRKYSQISLDISKDEVDKVCWLSKDSMQKVMSNQNDTVECFDQDGL